MWNCRDHVTENEGEDDSAGDMGITIDSRDDYDKCFDPEGSGKGLASLTSVRCQDRSAPSGIEPTTILLLNGNHYSKVVRIYHELHPSVHNLVNIWPAAPRTTSIWGKYL